MEMRFWVLKTQHGTNYHLAPKKRNIDLTTVFFSTDCIHVSLLYYVLKKQDIKGCMCLYMLVKEKEKPGKYFGLNFEVDDVQTSWASISTLAYPLLEELQHTGIGSCTNIFMAAWSVIAKTCKKANFINRRMDKLEVSYSGNKTMYVSKTEWTSTIHSNIDQLFRTGGDLVLQGTVGNVWRHLWFSQLGSKGRDKGCG